MCADVQIPDCSLDRKVPALFVEVVASTREGRVVESGGMVERLLGGRGLPAWLLGEAWRVRCVWFECAFFGRWWGAGERAMLERDDGWVGEMGIGSWLEGLDLGLDLGEGEGEGGRE